MKYALVNPAWTFQGGIYFGCREPHLPLEYGYARHLLEREGHEVLIVDGQLDGLSRDDLRARVAGFAPDATVITTAPSYLFWRCPPPELRVPQETAADLAGAGGVLIGVGPHASTTPRAALRKLGVDVVVMGECEEVLPRIPLRDRAGWSDVPSIAYEADGAVQVHGVPHASDVAALPPLAWSGETVRRHRHHHHRFEAEPRGPGAEIEASRGCPYHCSFCAKANFRSRYRRRPVAVILEELDRLIAQGIEYVYFVDEIFLPNRELLEALVPRGVTFGVQTRIDLWNAPMIDLLGAAGCVSIEAGVESISQKGRDLLDKESRLSTKAIMERLVYARSRVPFVQANLIDAKVDRPADVEAWRERLIARGVWANKPVPLFPYPGSPGYTKLWGPADDQAWERAHDYYLGRYADFSDVQDDRPLPLAALERDPAVWSGAARGTRAPG